MKYTGIRAVPYDTPSRIMQPHIARYQFTTQIIQQADVVMDIACGTGYGVSILKSAGYDEIYGVDLDHSAVKFAADHNLNLKGTAFIQANGSILPFRNHSFDLITCFETFEHLIDSKRFLNELYRVLKPSGKLIISVPNAPLWAPFSAPPDLTVEDIRLGLGHKYDFTAGQFYNLLSEYFESITPYGQDFRRISFLTKVLRQIERGVIYLKYRLAHYGLMRRVFKKFLSEAVVLSDLTLQDQKWLVKEYPNNNYEPVFCVAVCKK